MKSSLRLKTEADDSIIEAVRDVLLRILNKTIVHQDQLNIEVTYGEKTAVFQIDVAKEDFGRLLGSKGKNIDALRTIVLIMSASHGVRAIIQIKDESKFF